MDDTTTTYAEGTHLFERGGSPINARICRRCGRNLRDQVHEVHPEARHDPALDIAEGSWQPPDREPVAPGDAGLVGARRGGSLLPLSEDEADLIRALRGDDVAAQGASYDAALDTAVGFRAAVTQAASEAKPFTVLGVRYAPVLQTPDPGEGAVKHHGRTYAPLELAERATQTTIEVRLLADRLNGVHLPPGERWPLDDGWMTIPALIRYTGAEAV